MKWAKIEIIEESRADNEGNLIINETRNAFIDIDKIIYITEGEHKDLSFIVIDDFTFTVKGTVDETMNEIEWWRNR